MCFLLCGNSWVFRAAGITGVLDLLAVIFVVFLSFLLVCEFVKIFGFILGAPEEALVRIEQPRRAFRVGENVEILCRSASRDVAVEWIKRDEQGNRQFVYSNVSIYFFYSYFSYYRFMENNAWNCVLCL